MSKLIRQQVDDAIRIETVLNRSIISIRELLMKKNESLEKVVTQQGSTIDGGSLTRLCYPGAPKHEVELDLFYNGGSYPKEFDRCIHEVEGKPAHVKIEYDPVFLQYLHPRIQEPINLLNTGCGSTGYINSRVIKEIARDKTEFKDDGKVLKNAMSFLFGISFDKVRIESQDEVKQATATTTISVKFLKENTELVVKIDHVPGLHLMFWPKQASGWLKRDTLWPCQADKQAIVEEGCHVVPKPSTEGDNDLEWRFSFSNAESKLMKMLSPEQKRAYFLFKSIFYMHIKPIEGQSPSGKIKEVFFSYLVKTTILYVCETKLRDDPLWADANIINSVSFLVEYMEKQLKNAKVPHYFIPEVNLIQDICQYAPDAWNKAICKLEKVRENTVVYIPWNLVEIAERGTELNERMTKFNHFAHLYASGDAERMLAQFRPFFKT